MSLQALKAFAADLKQKFDLPGQANPEDQLKGPIQSLMAEFGKAFALVASTKTEAQLTEQNVRPDVAVYVDGLICGYIELKQPGLGANAAKLKSKHNKEQWAKLKFLPNLLYTDGREWALYRGGEPVGVLLRFGDDPSQAGPKAIDDQTANDLEKLIRDFLFWAPHTPNKPTELAAYLAPLTRFLRSEVEAALLEQGSAIGLLADEWRNFFFPDADNAQFADAYAQTITYALLLARLSGAEKLSPAEAAKTLDKGNGLLARTLELLGQPGARDELRVGFELLQRSLEALSPKEFLQTKPDLWLYFYEDFLAAYDPKLRNDYGVYYTPREVVELQVRLASELLETRFNKKLGFADDGVVFLDPAFGTGTYLVATVSRALEKVAALSGQGAVAARATQMAENMYGFEILVGPYAVAHLRLKQTIESAGGSLPTLGEGKNAEKRLKLFLADTLESPFTTPPGGLDLTHRKLTEEREAARKVKQGGDILVCLGNPPYDRQQIEEGDENTQRKGGWVRFGDQIKGGAKQDKQNIRPIFSDFLEPASKAGAGVHLKNLYNDYVYFWRWALWRLFEQQNCGGILTFITASSYLAGPGFIGMREVMRRMFDDVWIIDLGGDNHGTRKTPNIFNIQTPVAIAIGVRGSNANPQSPAKVKYSRINGVSREAKLAQLSTLEDIDHIGWQDCPDEWHKPFLPIGVGNFFDWPLLADLFPWAHSGAQFKRSWPIGETKEVLLRRWKSLVSAAPEARRQLFRETGGWTITHAVKEKLPGNGEPSLYEATKETKPPDAICYTYRAFDRQFALYDFRLGDRLRPPLYRSYGDKQIFLFSMMTKVISKGPAIGASSHLPDLDVYCGRGGKDIIPLYRDANAIHPNITNGVLLKLSETYGKIVTPEDMAAYIFALLGGQSYTARFWNELETPGPRIPITKDSVRFSSTTALGRRLIWLQTFGDRFPPKGEDSALPSGTAMCTVAIPSDQTKYPERFEYQSDTQELHVGEGRFHPVTPEIWEFEVSGLKVVESWLGYRMKIRAGKKSSPLDEMRPDHWTPRMTDELLELLRVIEATLAVEPALSAALDAVVAGPCFMADELPQPTEEERQPPKQSNEEGDLLSIMEASDEDEHDG